MVLTLYTQYYYVTAKCIFAAQNQAYAQGLMRALYKVSWPTIEPNITLNDQIDTPGTN